MAHAGSLEGREVPPLAAPPRARRVLWVTVNLVATLVAGAAVVALAAVAIGPRLGLFRMETVLSGSMRPTFSPGDVVVVTPEPTSSVRVGQIITYQIPTGDHHVESHRVIRLDHPGAHPVVTTKGDANSTADPWKARLTSDTAWRERLAIPKLGWLIIWLRQPLVQRFCVLVVPFLLAAWWLVRIWRPRSRAGQPVR